MSRKGERDIYIEREREAQRENKGEWNRERGNKRE